VQLLVNKKISGIPVVDAAGAVLGMIRRAACARTRHPCRSPFRLPRPSLPVPPIISLSILTHPSPFPFPYRSGYDLLVLDATPGHVDKSEGLFPRVGKCDEFGGSLSRMWTAFSDMQEVIQKTGGSTAADVCHEAATVNASARLEDAADLIVRRKVHRLAVVDAAGRCVGIISRGDILKATLQVRAVAVAVRACACVRAVLTRVRACAQRLRAMNGAPR
jgi:CBS domain-containing protein